MLASPHAGSDWRFKEQDAFPDTTAMVVCDRPYAYSCRNGEGVKRRCSQREV